jgi:hypothetical protein
MANQLSPAKVILKKDWSPTEVVKHDTRQSTTTTQWWFERTSIPEVANDASFFKREAVRKSQLLSIVLFYYTIVVIVFLPCCFFLRNPNIAWADGGLIISAFTALHLNRRGFTGIAAIIIVVMYELMLSLALVLLTPLDEPSIQLYDLYIMAELLAVSLLPARNVFVIALANSMIILASLVIQPHLSAMNLDLQSQFIPLMIRPIALQFIVAGVSYVWVRSTTKAIARADRAEMIATLEHALGNQKQDLQEGIEQILKTHVAIANGNFNARAPLTQDNSLWQIARALNTLLVRLQRAVQAERELQRVERAVSASVHVVQLAEEQHQSPHLPFTQTTIDPLIAVLQGKTLSYVQSPFSQKNTPYIQLQNESRIPNYPPYIK